MQNRSIEHMLEGKDIKKLEQLLAAAVCAETSESIKLQLICFNKLLLKKLSKNHLEKAKPYLRSIEVLNSLIISIISFRKMIIDEEGDKSNPLTLWIESTRQSIETLFENLERAEEEEHEKRISSPRLSETLRLASLSSPPQQEDSQVDDIISQLTERDQDIIDLAVNLHTKIYKSHLLKRVKEIGQIHFDIKTTQFYATGAMKIESFERREQVEAFKKYLEAWKKLNPMGIRIMRACLDMDTVLSQSSFLLATNCKLSSYKEFGKSLKKEIKPTVKKTHLIKNEETQEEYTKEISLVDMQPTHTENIRSVISLIDQLDSIIERKLKKFEPVKKFEALPKTELKEKENMQESVQFRNLIYYFLK